MYTAVYLYMTRKTKLADCMVDDLVKYIEEDRNAKIEPSTRLHLEDARKKIIIRWSKSFRNQKRFLTRNSTWLEESIPLTFLQRERSPTSGRPPLHFESMSRRSKLRAIQDLRRHSSEELITWTFELDKLKCIFKLC